jgi:hypothetical protein
LYIDKGAPLRKALRRRKARVVGRKLMKEFRRHGIGHASIETKAPRWYFTGDVHVSRMDRLAKMADLAGCYILEATGRNYAIEAYDHLSGRVYVQATLLPDNLSQMRAFIPTPRSRS